MAEETTPVKRPVKLGIAGLALVVLVGTYIVVQNLPGPTGPESPEWEPPEIVNLTDFDQDVQTIRLIGGEDTITISRDENRVWRVEYPHDVRWLQHQVGRPGNTFPLISAERRLEDPDDLSVYGLIEPKRIVEATLEDGTVARVLIGDETPSRTGYYAMKEGDEDVYVIGRFNAASFLVTYNDLRDKNLPNVDTEDIQYLELNPPPPGERIIVRRVTDDDDRTTLLFSMYQITSPFGMAHAIDGERFQELLDSFPAMFAERFVDDRPSDYAQYGLGPAAPTVRLRDSETDLTVVFGKRASDSTYYARIVGRPEVFTLRTDLSFFDTDPFTIVSKFALILSIDKVDRFVVETPDERFVARVERTDDPDADETFYLNDRVIEDKPFREYYQKAIGLLADGRNRNPVRREPEVTVTYHLTDFEQPFRLELVPHTRGFYAAYRDGRSDFLVSDVQVDRLIAGARSLLE